MEGVTGSDFAARRVFTGGLLGGVLLGVVLVVLASTQAVDAAAGECFPAIFNFGDSTSDTGGIHATFPRQTPAEFPPYGDTYPKKPWKRYSDGLMLIDFIARGLGLNYLFSSMQPVDSDYSSGANFATAGATVMPITYMSPFPLPVQYLQFLRFQKDVLALRANPDTPEKMLARIPAADAFRKGLYILALGGNDFTYGYNKGLTLEEVDQYIPVVAEGLINAVRLFYEVGGRNFIIFDIENFGCLPYFLTFMPHTEEDLDDIGCIKRLNAVTASFNEMLIAKVAEARPTLPDASIHVFRSFDVKMELYGNLTANGFKYFDKACCGVPSEHNYHLEVNCGKAKTIKGVLYTPVKCDNPNEYTIWDGVHHTENAGRYIAQKLLDGNHFDVPYPELAEMCVIPDLTTVP